jgi:glycerophosphoryl diester phosphodiesterase
MTALTWLGSEAFFILCLPFGYWLWLRPAFARMATLLLTSLVLNAALKELWQAPRPDAGHLVNAAGWSFPSGHAQNAAAMWGWLALELGGRRAGLAALALTLGIMASRVYLGVHRPIDVIGGALVGLVLVGVGVLVRRSALGSWLVRARVAVAVVGAVTVAIATLVVVLLTDREGTAIRASGALIGFTTGASWLHRSCPQSVAPEWWRRVLAGVLGLAVTLALWKGVKLVGVALSDVAELAGAPELAAPSERDGVAQLMTLVRYALVGGWVAAGSWLAFDFFRLTVPRSKGRAARA